MKAEQQTESNQKNEINLYISSDDILKSICQLASKILEDQKKILILCAPDQVNQIDSSLWTFGRNRFIPHITSNDKNFDFARQPIIITSEENNFNNADYLIFTDAISSNFIGNFTRSFCFTGNENTKTTILKNLGNSCKISLHKKEGKKWLTENIS